MSDRGDSYAAFREAAELPDDDRDDESVATPVEALAELTDAQYVAVMDAAYEAIEARGRECKASEADWQLAQVLFDDGFRAAWKALRGSIPAPHEGPPLPTIPQLARKQVEAELARPDLTDAQRIEWLVGVVEAHQQAMDGLLDKRASQPSESVPTTNASVVRSSLVVGPSEAAIEAVARVILLRECGVRVQFEEIAKGSDPHKDLLSFARLCIKAYRAVDFPACSSKEQG